MCDCAEMLVRLERSRKIKHNNSIEIEMKIIKVIRFNGYFCLSISSSYQNIIFKCEMEIVKINCMNVKVVGERIRLCGEFSSVN